MDPVLDRHALRRHLSADPRMEAKAINADADGDTGEFTGYAAVWNNVDLQGEVIRVGAFKRTLNAKVAARKVKLMVRHYAHGGDTTEVVGTVVEAKEDDYGLWIRGKFSSIPRAQETRTLIQEGHLDGLSVGYFPVRGRRAKVAGKQVVELLELELAEVTITPKPANGLTRITSAKSQDALAPADTDAPPAGTSDPDPAGTGLLSPAGTAGKSAVALRRDLDLRRAQLDALALD
jgi:hypothetical protein